LSGLEHSPESLGVRGQGERPKAVSLSDFPYFRLHPGRTEENGQDATTPDRVEQLTGAIGMVVVIWRTVKPSLRYPPGTNVHPSQTSEGAGKTIAQSSVSPLSESTMKELRTALTEQLKQPDGPTPELSIMLKGVGREARESDIPPEELIVIFKELWNSLAESLRPQNADQYERVRQRLVTLCIQAYYAE
jgi:hypothetical protein